MEATKSEFKSYIKTLLSYGKISKKYQETYVQDEHFKYFQQAFTDPSYNDNYNSHYQVLEFMGDGVLKGALNVYIIRTAKQGHTEGYYNFIRKELENNNTLSSLADKIGMWKYVNADENTLATKKNQTLANVFEAFIGAVITVVNNVMKEEVGYTFAHHFIYYVLDNHLDKNIFNKSEEGIKDNITKLTELYKAKNLKNNIKPLRWGNVLWEQISLTLPIVNEFPKNVCDATTIIKDNTVYIYVAKLNRWYASQQYTVLNKLIPYEIPVETCDGILVMKEFPKSANSGNIIVFNNNKWVYNDTKWVLLSQYEDLENTTPYVLPYQKTTYIKVYGYPHPKLKYPQTIYKDKQVILLGQGTSFVKNKAKHIAFTNSLNNLQKNGFETDYTLC